MVIVSPRGQLCCRRGRNARFTTSHRVDGGTADSGRWTSGGSLHGGQLADSRTQAHAHYFLIVFGFVGLSDLVAVAGVDTPPAAAAGVACILAWTHHGMAAAECGDVVL